MKRKPTVEHLEDAVILAYLDGELSRADARMAKHHLQSCWNCRSAAAELELLAQTAYALLSDGDESDAVQTGTAKAEFLRRKAKSDETWGKKLRRSTSTRFQRSRVLDGTRWSTLYRSEPMKRLSCLSRSFDHLASSDCQLCFIGQGTSVNE